jgi:hypothetical protein
MKKVKQKREIKSSFLQIRMKPSSKKIAQEFREEIGLPWEHIILDLIKRVRELKL